MKKLLFLVLSLGLFLLALPVLAENIRNTVSLEQEKAVYLHPNKQSQDETGKKSRKALAAEQVKKEQQSLSELPGQEPVVRLKIKEEERAGQHLPFNFLYYLFYKFSLNEFFKSPAQRKSVQ